MQEQEDSISYQKRLYLKEDSKLSSFGILTFNLLILIFIYVDYAFITTSSEFYKLLVIKLLISAVSLLSFVYLKFSKEKKFYSWVIFIWLMLLISMMHYSGTTRPVEYITGLPLDVSIVFANFVIFRNKLILQIIPSIYLSTGLLLQLYLMKIVHIEVTYFIFIVAIIAVHIIGIFASCSISKFRRTELNFLENEYKIKSKLEKMAFQDELTSLQNRRSILHSSKTEFERFKRYHKNLCLMILDIDDFKLINDTYGHDNGDIALKFFANIVSSMKRSPDHIGRIGGEEFLMLLPETDVDQAHNIAERMQDELNNNLINIDNQKVKLTVSIGLTSAREQDETFNNSMRRADDYLYVAKERGKNNIYSGS